MYFAAMTVVDYFRKVFKRPQNMPEIESETAWARSEAAIPSACGPSLLLGFSSVQRFSTSYIFTSKLALVSVRTAPGQGSDANYYGYSVYGGGSASRSRSAPSSQRHHSTSPRPIIGKLLAPESIRPHSRNAQGPVLEV